MTGGTCIPCGARLRSRRQWICRECVKAGDRAFRRLYPFTDADQHQRNVSAWYRDFERRIREIRVELGLATA